MDNTAQDGVVCSGDTVSYGINLSVTGQSTDSTYLISAYVPNSMDLTQETIANLCVSDPQGNYTGTVVNSDTRRITCKYTFPANSSFSGVLRLTGTAVHQEWANPDPLLIAPEITVTNVADSTAAVAIAPSVKVVSAYAFDAQFGPTTAQPTTKIVIGSRTYAQSCNIGIG